MLGMVFAALYVSAKIAVPSAASMMMLRTKPVIRDTTVPRAITLLDRSRLAEPAADEAAGEEAGEEAGEAGDGVSLTESDCSLLRPRAERSGALAGSRWAGPRASLTALPRSLSLIRAQSPFPEFVR